MTITPQSAKSVTVVSAAISAFLVVVLGGGTVLGVWASQRADAVAESAQREAERAQRRADQAMVEVTGDATRVRLFGETKRYEAGPVPPGPYTIHATFPGAAAAPAGTIDIAPRQTVTLHCTRTNRTCVAQ